MHSIVLLYFCFKVTIFCQSFLLSCNILKCMCYILFNTSKAYCKRNASNILFRYTYSIDNFSKQLQCNSNRKRKWSISLTFANTVASDHIIQKINDFAIQSLANTKNNAPIKQFTDTFIILGQILRFWNTLQTIKLFCFIFC